MTHPKTYLRYLPAEGEIKVGDYYHCDGSIKEGQPFRVDDEWGFPPKESHPFKVERYAVTTEFTIGDKVIDIDGIEFTLKTDKEIELADAVNKLPYGMKEGKGWFKILAPISPAVTWKIEDGAEIEVSKRIYVKHGDDSHWKLPMGGLPHKQEKVFMQVKGPCGHFH